MDFFILLKRSFFFLCIHIFPLVKASSANNCNSTYCGLVSPEIRFPFCGLPHFSLLCKENRTMIHFPSHGNLIVKSISYDTQLFDLLDPNNCVHEVFLNLNLSLTPFNYYYDLKQYRYINCSDKLVSSSYEQVPCLSGPDHHVYVVSSSVDLPSSCTCVKTVAIPFSYTPYLSGDSSFGLRFTWKLSATGLYHEPGCETGQVPEKYFKNVCVASRVIALVVVLGMVFYATISWYRREYNKAKVQDMLGERANDKLLGEHYGRIVDLDMRI